MPLSKILSSASGRQQYLAYSTSNSPFLNVNSWNSDTGFGAKYSNPSTLPTGFIQDISFSTKADQIIAAINTSANFAAYSWTSSGFGTKFSNPTTIVAAIGCVAFSPSSDVVAVGYEAVSPFVNVYAWSSAGFGTKFSDPASTAAAGFIPASINFSPSGDALVVGGFGAGGVSFHGWPWSSAGFGTKYSTSGETNRIYDLAFNSLGTVVYKGTDTFPFVTAQEFSSSTGFGTTVSPSTSAGSTVYGVSVAQNSGLEYVAVATISSPYHGVYTWTNGVGNGWGSRQTTTNFSLNDQAYDIQFNKPQDSLAIGYGSTPYISAVKWTGTTFGTRYSNPSTLPTTGVVALAYGANG